MPMRYPPTVSLHSAEPTKLVAQLVAGELLPRTAPGSMRVAGKDRAPSADWRRTILGVEGEEFELYWDAGVRFFTGGGDEKVINATLDLPGGAGDLPAFLSGLNADVITVASLYRGWDTVDPDYAPPLLGQGHYGLGWACAFKGSGHDRLTSRRWLEYGPWLLRRERENFSFVQFHALDAPPEVALAQARPGHERMASLETGGILFPDLPLQREIEGTYDAALRVLKIPVLGRTVSQYDMLEVRTAQRYNLIPTPGPLERIAFVFLDEAEAAPHLRELWLRGLECWTIRDGLEVRLDEGLWVEPDTPDWAR